MYTIKRIAPSLEVLKQLSYMNDNKPSDAKSSASFQTTDLSLVAVISLWLPIEEIDRTNPRKAIFLFNKCRRLDELVNSFWRKELKVEPQAYFSQLKAIKARLYE